MNLHGTHRTVTVIYSDLEGVFSALEQYANTREEERLLVDEGIPEGASQADFTRVLKAVTSSQDLLLEEYLKSRNHINKLSLELGEDLTVQNSIVQRVKNQSRMLLASLEPVIGHLEIVREGESMIARVNEAGLEDGPDALELRRDVNRAQANLSLAYNNSRPLVLVAMRDLEATVND